MMQIKIFRLSIVCLLTLFICSTAQAQFGKRLGKAVENAAKNATVRKAEQKTDEAVGKGIDKATDPNTYKDKDGGESKKESSSSEKNANATEDKEASDEIPQKGVKAAEMAYVKSDFVAGDEIIFDDPMQGEQLGEFPSQWDLVNGTAEIVSFGGVKGINFETDAAIAPLMKDMNNYLPDVFTVEFDFWYEKNSRTMPYNLYFYDGRDEKLRFVFGNDPIWNYKTPADESRKGEGTYTYTDKAWNHFSLSFNKRALKVYLNGVRVTNIPSMATSKRLQISAEGNNYGFKKVITNVRIAKGAVPLYDRMMTDGKFITYGITFDVGKSTIKPESMGEINRIVTLMQDNPDLKFSVEGHTDNTGSAATNQKLSDERSAAVVAKLLEMSISKDRLQSAGKGQNSPIADNLTDEGRAKNRRVEFVKIN